MKYSFDIDEKSLYRGVKNDYKKGQSATVHTPLNQAKNKKNWRNDIYEFIKGYKSEDILSLPEPLKDKCLSKTTSRATGKIIGFYVFSNFALDGVQFNAGCSFAMYVKEETSNNIKQRNGNIVVNTHLGRQKLHYPITLSCFSNGYNIDNNKVLETIIKENGGFAYVVKGFDIDSETKTLNFRTTMIGLKGVLLSNVFKRKKGVGSKLLLDGVLAQIGITSTEKANLSNEEKNTFIATLEKIQESSRANGRAGEKYVVKNIKKILDADSVENIIHISEKFPQSPYDIECIVNGEIMYIEVKSTKNNNKVFYMSKGERRFMDKYDKNYLLILVTNVNSIKKNYNCYHREDIVDTNKVTQEIQGIKYVVKQ